MIRVMAMAVASSWGLMVLLSLVEAVAPGEEQGMRRRMFNLAYIPFLVAFLILVVQPLSARGATAVLRFSDGGMVGRVLAPRGAIGQLLFGVVFAVAWDLWRYWFHRLQHTIPLLWSSHRFHHTETAVNVTTHGRHHGLSFLYAELAYLPFLMIFGTLAPHFLVTFLMFRIWGYLVHMNVRLPLGIATPWIAGPQWHRIHHSVEPEHQGRNFATFFPAIDMLFGTYYRPAAGEYPRCGLAGHGDVDDVREATVQPIVDGMAIGARMMTALMGWLRRRVPDATRVRRPMSAG